MSGTVVLLAAGTAGCTGSSGPATGRPPSPGAALAVLNRQAAAVRGHDRAAFLATLDGSAAAAPFRSAQARAYADLARVPLAMWQYRSVGPIRDRAAVHAAQRKYGAPALLLHVTFEYELAGVDSLPDRHDQYLIFVQRHGATLLAGDTALASEGTQSWRPPWSYGALIAARGTTSLVLGPPGDRAELPTLASEVDSAIGTVTRVWGTDWARKVAVLVPATTAEFTALTGNAATDISAAAVTDGIDPATGRPYGQRLVLDPAQLDRLTAVGRRIVLRHETTHLATAAATADITPRWLVEGFAEYVGNLGSGQPVRAAAAELRAAVAAGRVPAQLPSDTAFDATGAALARAYEQSWLACRLIAQRVGQPGLVHFYRAVGTAVATKAAALAAAFRQVLHEPQSAFTRQWRTYLKAQLS